MNVWLHLCVYASVCERERPVDPQCFLATFGKLSCGTVSQCTGRSVALTGLDLQGFDLGIP